MKITVCGSMAFYKEMEQIRDQLVDFGHEVKIPELKKEAPDEFGGSTKVSFRHYIEENGGVDAFSPDHEVWNQKREAILDHFNKIEWADAILVTNYEKHNIGGYIGGNSLIEVGVAFYTKKQIYILNPISSNLSYKMEVLAMRPILLEGDLGALKI